GTTRLHYAVKEGYDAAVHYFIKKGDPLDLKDKDGNTALHYATDYGHTRLLCIVELLLSRGADVFFRDENQRTLLHCLVQKEGNSGAVIDKRIIELLLKKGVDIDAVDVNGESALFIAIRNPFMTHTIDTLLSKGSNARLINQKGQSPLVYAVDTDCCRITPSLIRMNTLEINARDKFGCTALHYAVSVGNVHIVRDLVRAKADPAITNNEGDTPLMIALKDG
ncbi:ankyrin, partial [Zopfia rhizophila CBS 207.26]